MSYILLLVQQYQPSAAQAFLKLEAEFKELERRSPQFPQGKRYQLLSEGEPTNTLVWEGEFASLDDVQNALNKMAHDPTHTALFEKQLPYIITTRTEIYKVLDL
jgi:hypothetical protein